MEIRTDSMVQLVYEALADADTVILTNGFDKTFCGRRAKVALVLGGEVLTFREDGALGPDFNLEMLEHYSSSKDADGKKVSVLKFALAA